MTNVASVRFNASLCYHCCIEFLFCMLSFYCFSFLSLLSNNVFILNKSLVITQYSQCGEDFEKFKNFWINKEYFLLFVILEAETNFSVFQVIHGLDLCMPRYYE